MKTTEMNVDGVYEYDYQNGMKMNIPTRNNQTYFEVLKRQSQYDFLGHRTRTKEETENLIKKTIGRVKTLHKKVMVLLFAVGMGISLQSCERDTIQKELITQEFKLTEVVTTQMNKNYDPATWVYEYNQTPAVLTFQNVTSPSETITRTVTVQELINGISLSMYAGTYNLTFATIHNSNTNVDIQIDMPDVVIVGTPVELLATYMDYLLVVDMQDILSVYMSLNADALFWFTKVENYYYAYYNVSDPNYRMYIDFGSRADVLIPTTNYIFGNVYWYTSPFNAGTTLEFPEWTVNKITL